MTKAQLLGVECAERAYEAGGGIHGPWSEVSLSYEPQDADWLTYDLEAMEYAPGEAGIRGAAEFSDAYEARLRELVSSGKKGG